jgi:hypothetical protein
VEGGNPVIDSNLMEHNHTFGPALGACGCGGAIYLGTDSSPTIVRNVIRYNSAPNGGGIASYGSEGRFAGNLVVGNRAEFGGGASIQVAGAAVVAIG